MSFSTCFTSLCFTLLVSPYYTNLSSSDFSLFLFLHPSLFSLFSYYLSIVLLTSIRSGKVANVERISGCTGFTGRLSNSTRGFPFPASTRTTWCAASRFVLSYCRGLSHQCVLTTAARPMHDPVPSGIRQFCLFVPSLVSLSLVRSTRRIYRARCKPPSTRIAQCKITQEFNSTLNSLRPEMRFGCNQALIVHKWLPQRNWVPIFLLIFMENHVRSYGNEAYWKTLSLV